MFNSNKYPSCRPIRHYRERFIKSSSKIAHNRFNLPNGIIENNSTCDGSILYGNYLTKENKKNNCSETSNSVNTCTIKN